MFDFFKRRRKKKLYKQWINHGDLPSAEISADLRKEQPSKETDLPDSASQMEPSGKTKELFDLAGYLPSEHPTSPDPEKHKLLAELDILLNRVTADTNRIKSIIRQLQSKP